MKTRHLHDISFVRESRLAHFSVEQPEFTSAAPGRENNPERDEDRKNEQQANKQLVEKLEKSLTSAQPDQRTDILRAIISVPGGRPESELGQFGWGMLNAHNLSVSDVMPLTRDDDARVARRAFAVLAGMFSLHIINLANGDARAAAEADTNLYADAVIRLVGRPTTSSEILAAQESALNRQASTFALMLVRVSPGIRTNYFARLSQIERTLSRPRDNETPEERGYRESLLKTIQAHPQQLQKQGTSTNPLPVANWLDPESFNR